MRVAVTGGTGCLGRPLISKLLESGIETKLLVLTQEKIPEEFKQNVELIYGHLDSTDDLVKLVENCDVVFHLAGKVHAVPKTPNEEKEFYRVNVDGTRNLIQACSLCGIKRIIFYSTVGVYGKDGDFHGDEQSICEPVSVYGKSKLMAEKLILESESEGGPQGVVLRFPVVYGAYDKGNVQKLIRSIIKKRFFFFGDGLCHRSLISSLNAAEAAFCAASEPFSGSDVFCVTDGKDYQMIELIEAICCAVSTTWRPFHIPILAAKLIGKIGDIFERATKYKLPVNSQTVMKLSSSLTFSCEKAKKTLHYQPVVTLYEGIWAEVEWIKQHIG